MTIAVDTSVLIAIAKDEPGASDWVEFLAMERSRSDLVICEVVGAEYFAVVLDDAKFRTSLEALGISFSPMTIESAQLAGRLFRDYRREGGRREHLIPDFLIGAHAQKQAHGIAATDRGYLSRYFPRLKVKGPN